MVVPRSGGCAWGVSATSLLCELRQVPQSPQYRVHTHSSSQHQKPGPSQVQGVCQTERPQSIWLNSGKAEVREVAGKLLEPLMVKRDLGKTWWRGQVAVSHEVTAFVPLTD